VHHLALVNQLVGLLCAFIKYNGLRLLRPVLSAYLQAQPRRGLRVLTTVFLGATFRRDLDLLVSHGTEVCVSYDTRRTPLYAKAWQFHRPGFSGVAPSSTAYIGPSNLSTAALHDGLEWNVASPPTKTKASWPSAGRTQWHRRRSAGDSASGHPKEHSGTRILEKRE
jgi:HKD family nuclease